MTVSISSMMSGFLSVCTELSDLDMTRPDLIRDLPGGLVLRIELQNLAGNIPSVLIDVRQCTWS